MIFAVRDMEQYTTLSRQLFFRSNNVRHFRTLVTMDAVKVSLDVPIGQDRVAHVDNAPNSARGSAARRRARPAG